MTILGQPNIDFDPFKTLINRQLNGRQGILRCRPPHSTMDNELNGTCGKNRLKEICTEKGGFAGERRQPEDG